MTYIAVFKDNKLVSFNSLEDVQQLPYVEYIFKKELHEDTSSTTGKGQPFYNKYRYTPINFDGTKRIITKGKFELINIEPDRRYGNTFQGRELKIYDHSKSLLRETISMTAYQDFIVKDLLPMLNTLEVTNSWDIYVELEEAKQMKTRIEKQRIEIDTLKTKIKNLEEQIKDLTAIADK